MDAGCGNGALTSRITQLGYQVIGIDQSSEGIALAQSQFPGIPFHLSSVYEDYRSITSAVDVVLSSEVIEHLAHPRTLLQRAYEVLKPGGTLILTTPFHGYWKNLALSLTDGWDNHFHVHRDLGHIKFFSQRTLSLLLHEEGFTELQYANAGRVWGLWKSLVVKASKPSSPMVSRSQQ